MGMNGFSITTTGLQDNEKRDPSIPAFKVDLSLSESKSWHIHSHGNFYINVEFSNMLKSR